MFIWTISFSMSTRRLCLISGRGTWRIIVKQFDIQSVVIQTSSYNICIAWQPAARVPVWTASNTPNSHNLEHRSPVRARASPSLWLKVRYLFIFIKNLAFRASHLSFDIDTALKTRPL